MDVPNQIKSRLVISGYECEANEITNRLGLTPNEIACKSDIRREDPNKIGPPIRYEENLWIYNNDYPENKEAEDHLSSMISILETKKEILQGLALESNIELSIFGYVFHPQVGLSINPETIDTLSDMGVGLDIDIYSLVPLLIGTQDERKTLSERLNKVKTVSSIVGIDSLIDALATIENVIPEVSQNLVGDLFWDELNEDDIIERVNLIKNNLRNVKAKIEKIEWK